MPWDFTSCEELGDVERQVLSLDPGLIMIGVDEVGRGPLAGPVTACAFRVRGYPGVDEWTRFSDDSKRLTAKKRRVFLEHLPPQAVYAVRSSSAAKIDDVGIRAATRMAMEEAVAAVLPEDLDQCLVLIDGGTEPLDIPGLRQSTITKGDALSYHIGAASILAKIHRDAVMTGYARRWPYYGWDRNSGYGTKQHRQALNKYGVTPIHRKTFGPVKKLLQGTNTPIWDLLGED